tara:strand:- start:2432 stop:3361 length:930 start_codon:yes stop_codon:yes gene_type:complete
MHQGDENRNVYSSRKSESVRNALFDINGLFSDEMPTNVTETPDTPETGHSARRASMSPLSSDRPDRADRAEVSTMRDAFEHVERMMTVQIEKGMEIGITPNTSIAGDSNARTAFYTLLSHTQQRVVFLNVASNMQNWPRLRALFGAPPYSFLRSDDAHMLRAAGIAPSRSNMAHEEQKVVMGYSQFGTGQLVDEYEREYRVIPKADTYSNVNDASPVPWRFDVPFSAELTIQCRVKKRDKKRKLEMLKDQESKRRLTFPSIGEIITLQPSPGLTAILKNVPSEKTSLVVRRVFPRSENAATAVMMAVIK